MIDTAKHPRFSSVHAAAGSGKTYLLVSRLIVRLLQGANPGSILAITFTRKAAAEMQERLLQRVHELAIISDSELDEKLSDLGLPTDLAIHAQARGLYETLLHAQHPVRTTTFHAFCQDLLRRFPMEARVPPGFELTEHIGYLIDEAFEAYASELTAHPDSDMAQQMDILLAELGLTGSHALLERFVHHRSEWWALSQAAQFDLHTFLGMLESMLGADDTRDPIQILFGNDLVKHKGKRFAELLGKHATQTNLFHVQLLNDALHSELPLPKRFEILWTVFFTDKDTPRARAISDTLRKKLGDADSEQLVKLHEELCATLISVRQQLHGQVSFRLSKAWLICGQRFLSYFQKIKLAQRLLDFSDLEWHCYLLLNEIDHAEWVQYKLDQRIDHLLIDEFQDTNPTQWHLILPLLTEIAANYDSDRQRSVLFVGDSKQSIYRFRRAEPQLFAAATQWLENHLPAVRQHLSTSYRSSTAIIDFVNKLFADNPALPLDDFQLHETHKKNMSGQVMLLPLIEKHGKTALVYCRNPLQMPREVKDPDHFHEACLIAQKIQELMHARTAISDGQKHRHIHYGDILLLLRNHTHAQDFERALREAHIPYIGTERGTLLQSLEVMDMVNLLHWLLTPFDNLALAGILRSPLFACSDDDLQLLAGSTNWYQKLQDLTAQLETDHPFVLAGLHLPRWIELAELLPVHDLLDHVYSEANVLARYQANYPEYLRTQVHANLIRFIELALETDSGRYPSLTRFLERLNILRQQDKEAPDQPAGSHESNRVRMLTIHEAKGLEAPVVFLVDATTSTEARKGVQVRVDWPPAARQPETFFIAPTAAYPHAYCTQTIQLLDQKQQQEETNLLYVAVTRARQYLFISGINRHNGWYHAICNRYQIDAATLATPCLLEQYIPDSLHCDETPPAERTVTHIDPRMSRPMKLTPVLREIAPSRIHMQHQYATAGIEEDHRERGVRIHHMLECLAKQNQLGFDQYLQMTNLPANDAITACWHEATNVIKNYPDLFSATDGKHYIEVPLIFSQAQVTVHGVIDKLIVTGDVAHIIDYKTHLVPDAAAAISAGQQFREQLALYKKGVQRLYPHKTIKTSILFTCLPQLVELPLDS